MFKKHRIMSSKEKFVSPRVSQTVGVELECDILVGSPGTEVESSIKSLGHDVAGEYTINNPDYWE